MSFALNILVLLASGITLAVGIYVRPNSVIRYTWIAFALGIAFLLLQGGEWVRLLDFGMSAKTTLYSSFFYMLIGAHSLHVMGGIMALGYGLFRNWPEKTFKNVAYYWYFVVALWPVLYYLLYML